jgi:hypothetical protein
VAQPKQVSASKETRDEEHEGGIGTLSQVLGGTPEIEVDAVTETRKPNPSGPPMVVIRVNEDIEEMSYLAGGRRERYEFTAGHRYKVPVYIAQELEAQGRVWH